MAREWILALDQGTTNTKALLVDHEGRTAFRASAPVALKQPRPGYVEQDALALWESVCRVAEECVRFAAKSDGKIAAVAISNQRETAVAWRKDGAPVSHAISWQCRRSKSVCDRVRERASVIQARTGLPLDPLVSATKWAWLLERQPDLRAGAEAGEVLLGTVDAWLVYKLTGGRVHVTDHTNASRTALLNIDSLGWDDELLGIFGIPRSALPGVRTSSGVCGECTAIAGLEGVPIASLIGDSHAALVGHGRYEGGTLKATYGTGSSLMMLMPGLVAETKQLARAMAWSMPGEVRFALEGNIAMSGAAIQWVGEFLGLAHPAKDAAALAATVADAGGIVFVPALVGLGAPHWDAHAAGMMIGLRRDTQPGHIARAALEAIAFQVADVLEAVHSETRTPLAALRVDGGASVNDLLMQFQADVLGVPVVRPQVTETTALGAAYLAGLATGFWSGPEDLCAKRQADTRFEPKMEAGARADRRARWQKAVERAKAWTV